MSLIEQIVNPTRGLRIDHPLTWRARAILRFNVTTLASRVARRLFFWAFMVGVVGSLALSSGGFYIEYHRHRADLNSNLNDTLTLLRCKNIILHNCNAASISMLIAQMFKHPPLIHCSAVPR